MTAAIGDSSSSTSVKSFCMIIRQKISGIESISRSAVNVIYAINGENIVRHVRKSCKRCVYLMKISIEVDESNITMKHNYCSCIYACQLLLHTYKQIVAFLIWEKPALSAQTTNRKTPWERGCYFFSFNWFGLTTKIKAFLPENLKFWQSAHLKQTWKTTKPWGWGWSGWRIREGEKFWEKNW